MSKRHRAVARRFREVPLSDEVVGHAYHERMGTPAFTALVMTFAQEMDRLSTLPLLAGFELGANDPIIVDLALGLRR